MQITKDTVATVRYRIADAITGKLLGDSKEPVAYLHGHGNLLPKVEQALEGHEVGYSTTLNLPPADAMGERDEALLRTIPKYEFPPGVKVGGVLTLPNEDGEERDYAVAKIKGDTVHLDANHPWAGKTLRFSVTVIEVRAASQEEIQHGHAHGAHGHHH